MNRFLSMSLVLIFLINLVGSIGIIGYHRYSMKHYINSIIRNEKYTGVFIELKFSAEESAKLQWFEEDHEFKHNGHMYDIVSAEKAANDTIVYRCIKDEKESELFADIEKEFSQSTPVQKGRTTVMSLLHFLSTLFFDAQKETQEPHFAFLKHTSLYITHYISNQIDTPSDPPDTV